MAALTMALIAIAAVALGWCTIEIACKPCLDKGREAIDRNLNPDYDPDDQTSTSTSTTTLHAPLNPNKAEDDATAASSTVAKTV